MAEIFAIVSTCIGLASQIGKTIKTIDGLIEAYQSVPDDLESLSSWLRTTQRTIETLQGVIDTPGAVYGSVKDDINRSLASCLRTVLKLHGSVENIAADAAKPKADGTVAVVDKSARFRYLWNESSITVEKTELHQHMQAIDLLLNVVQFTQGYQQRVVIDRPGNAPKPQAVVQEGTNIQQNGTSQIQLANSLYSKANLHRIFHFNTFGKKTLLGKELCKAASEGDVGRIRSLIAKGAKVDFKSGSSAPYDTPSTIALSQRKLISLLVLAENGAAVNIRSCSDTHCCTPLSLAAEIGTTDDIKKLIGYGADPDFVISKEGGNAPLHIAAMLGRLEAVEALVEGKASLGLRGCQGQTPLHMAGSEEVSRALIRHGAPLHILDDNGELPLHSAARRGFRDPISDMLAQNAPLNKPNNWQSTPLSVACKNGHLELARYLCRRGGRLTVDDNGLGDACQFGALPDTIEAYISAGAPVNKLYLVSDGYVFSRAASPLQLACAVGYIDTAGHLLRNSANVNLKDRFGRTALHYAVERHGNRRDIIRLLLHSGADVNARDKKFMSPLHIAARYAEDASSDSPDPNVAQLLAAHPNVNVRDSTGYTPLHFLCQHSSAVSTLKTLLEAGADYSLADDLLRTPGAVLVAANSVNPDATKGYANMARLLVQAGAKGFDRRQERMKTLHDRVAARDLPAVNALLETGVCVSHDAFCAACEQEAPELVRKLIEGGADVNGSIQYGMSYDRIFPLHIACKVRSEPMALELCKILLEAGASSSVIMGHSDKTPWYFAHLRGHSSVMELLSKWKAIAPSSQ
ncbi:hypothetical protein FNYG_15304 [Fusarium nygamai]|uniref:Uncharacterized protein n=1 Tax=Gibberella nygamai TaxID=42673 RepID=A0A2K0UGP6_GIBNY|nr:hypothetical protein FNYG_15304 [Fusarium nygamai]